jgi:hypothetical protein
MCCDRPGQSAVRSPRKAGRETVTHSNHRQGTRENLKNDWVMLSLPYRGPAAITEKVEKYNDICRRHHPINPDRSRGWYIWVFDDRGNMEGALKELAEAELGLSVVVSGLFDEVAECCRTAGSRAHTVNHSLGFWGRTERLPPREVLEITTMCGHALVAPSLVWHLAERIRRGEVAAAAACQEMRKMCICDIFNHVRAEELMGQLVKAIEEGQLAAPQPSRGGGGHPGGLLTGLSGEGAAP